MIKLFFILLFTGLLVFKEVFIGSIYWGDSPFFYPEEIAEFFSRPMVWTSQGNNFGGINLVLWLSPLMLLWKFLGPQLLFIIPSIILSLIGPILLTRYLKFSKAVQFFSAAVYAFNTYFLLLIDGGQLGVSLAYGFFPLTVLALKRLIDKPSFKGFYLALTFLFLNGLADPRIAILAPLAVAVWNFKKIKELLVFIPLGLSWVLLNAFWLYPFLTNKGQTLLPSNIDVDIVKFFNPLLLFSPHWPDNLFGKVNTPPLYFLGIPFLIFIGVFLSRKKGDLDLLFSYLIFSFLSVFPIGTIFRDSTKFFIPVMLFAGMLIGKTVEVLKKKSVAVLVFLYLLFLVHPTILGKMNFVLSNRSHSNDFTKIYENLKNEEGFFRSLWFPERHPLAFGTEAKPAVDARELSKFLPFASINAGEDPFNFLNNEDFIENFRSLGIKYLILSGNPREIAKTPDEKKNWDSLVSLLDETKALEKVDWGTNIPIYKVAETKPHLFSVEKLIGVVGPNLSAKYPAVYFEDGKWDPRSLQNKASDSIKLFFNGKDEIDLAMSFLQKYFYFPGNASTSQWATYANKEYLKYKYQLLTRGVAFSDLDYGGGIAFSTQTGEEIGFKFEVPEDGNYIMAVRSMVPGSGEKSLVWKLEEPRFFPKGDFTYTVKNETDMKILNVVALIPQPAFKEAKLLAGTYLEKFSLVESEGLDNLTGYSPVDFSSVPANSWIVFTDNYHPMWKLKNGDTYSPSLPVYSMVNGFFVGEITDGASIEFLGQEDFRTGFFISAISLGTLLISGVLAAKSLKSN